MAASLPHDLIFDEIFPRLPASAVVRCAAACRAWRRAIIGSASRLRPARPDRFVPSLLLGFIFGCDTMCLQLVPGPFQSELPVTPVAGVEKFYSLVPPAPYAHRWLLSSRDGYLLLQGSSLCLYNPVTGEGMLLPYPELRTTTYVLVPGDHDLSAPDDVMGVQILAVATEYNHGEGMTSISSQLFSGAGAWGPVRHSSPVFDGTQRLVHMEPGTEVVCGGAVHWLIDSLADRQHCCTVAVDAGTGRAWTTELPAYWRLDWGRRYYGTLVLATSGDGRLSVVRALANRQIQVWVLTAAGGDKWILRRAIDVRHLLRRHGHPDTVYREVRLNGAFGSRSGCLLFHVNDVVFLIDADKGSARPFEGFRIIDMESACHCPYEMNWSLTWSTFISKMKHF